MLQFIKNNSTLRLFIQLNLKILIIEYLLYLKS